jgi:ankyrin repeat protein
MKHYTLLLIFLGFSVSSHPMASFFSRKKESLSDLVANENAKKLDEYISSYKEALTEKIIISEKLKWKYLTRFAYCYENPEYQFCFKPIFLLTALVLLDNKELIKRACTAGVNTEALEESGKTALHIAVRGDLVNSLEVLLNSGADINAVDSEGKSGLHIAALSCSLQCLELLLKRGINKDSVDITGQTALHKAASSSDLDSLKMLLNAGLDKDASDYDGITPFHIAILSRTTECALELLQRGANINETDKFDETALHMVVRSENFSWFRMSQADFLLKKGISKDAVNNHGYTALHKAVLSSDRPVLQVLLDAGVNKDAVDAEGNTALHLAVLYAEDPQVLHILLEAGVNKDAVDEHGNTPLHLAIGNGNRIQSAKLLLDFGASQDLLNKDHDTVLFLAAYNCDPESLKILIKAKYQKESVDKNGQTPLHIVAQTLSNKYGNSLNSLKILLEAGFNKEATDNDDQTPLHKAAHAGNRECLEELLREKVDLERVDRKGHTALHCAVLSGSKECLTLLLKASANKETPNKNSQTPLHTAASFDQADCLELLLNSRADAKITNSAGQTALHSAVRSNSKRCVVVILRLARYIKDICDLQGETALHIASHFGSASLCELLIDAGLDVNARTMHKMTPLMIACERGHKEVFSLLLGSKKLQKELKDDRLEGSALNWAAHCNRTSFCRELLAAGWDSSSKARSKSLLHCACEHENPDLIDLFLSVQSANVQDKNGMTALHYACRLGKIKSVEELVLKKARSEMNINLQCHAGKTALHYATESKNHEIVDLLLKYDASPNIFDMHKKSPIMYAAEFGYAEIARILVGRVSTVDYTKMKGYLCSVSKRFPELSLLFSDYQTVPPIHESNGGVSPKIIDFEQPPLSSAPPEEVNVTTHYSCVPADKELPEESTSEKFGEAELNHEDVSTISTYSFNED